MTYEEVYDACMKYFNGDTLAASTFVNKYLLRDTEGDYKEDSPDDTFGERICPEFHRIEQNYPNPMSLERIEQNVGLTYIIPQGSPLFGIGNPYQIVSLSNCFVLGQPPADSYAGILKLDERLVQVQKRRGGVGIDLSNLRPYGSAVNNAALTSDGPLSFMMRYSQTTEEVAQGGRRGALLMTLDCRHPDILEFIRAKSEKGKVEYANISVKWHDDFLEAVDNDEEYTLCFPVDANPEDANVTKTVKAREIWEESCKQAWTSGDPGCMFWDTVQSQSISDSYVSTSCSNPCLTGETLVWVADGRGNVPIKQLAEEDEDVPVFAYSKNNTPVIRTMRHPRKTGYKKPIYKVKLDDGSSIRTTENHKFLTVDKKFKEVKDLQPGDSLNIVTRFEASIKDMFPNANSRSQNYWWINNNGKSSYCEHRYIAEYHNSTKVPAQHVVHHRNFNAQDNRPENLAIMSVNEHDHIHADAMKGDNNPMRRAQTEWSDKKWDTYSFNLSVATTGIRNGNAKNVTNEGLKQHALHLTKKKGRKFSTKEWQRYAKMNNLPQAFSKWRRGFFDNVSGLAKWAAQQSGYGYTDADPRTLETYRKYSEKGYECCIQNNAVYLKKVCEYCSAPFYVYFGNREVSYCSHVCAAKDQGDDALQRALQVKKEQHKTRRENLRQKQIEIYKNLKWRTQRDLMRKEWAQECKNQSVSCEIGRKSSPFLNFKDLKETAEMTNHKVVSVEFDGYEDVYNGTVDEVHNFLVGGFEGKTENGKKRFQYLCNAQCGELPLSTNQSCILGSLLLTSFVNEPFTSNAKFDWDLFQDKISVMARIMDDMVDLEIEKVQKILQKIENDPEDDEVKQEEYQLWNNILENHRYYRKVGAGITGLADMLAMLNLQYGSDEAIEFTEKLFRFYQERMYLEGSMLAKERGAFPEWEWDKERDNYYINKLPNDTQESIKENGRRNITSLTVAPTGSISIAARVSSGIEPVFQTTYKRNRKMTADDEKNGYKPDEVDDNGNKWIKYQVHHQGLQKWKEITGLEDETKSSYYGCDAHSVSWQSRIQMQAAAQRHVDNSIASTINLNKDTEQQTIDEIYFYAWHWGLKGVTVFRDGCKQGVLDTGGIREATAPERPKILPCDIHYSNIKCKETGEMNNWILLVGLFDGQVYEIFGGHRKSVEIPNKYSKGWIVKDKGQYDLVLGSLDDDNEKLVVHDIPNTFAPDPSSYTRSVSMDLRYGIPISVICDQLLKDSYEADMFSFEKAVSRVLRKYVKNGEKSAGICPHCNTKGLEYQEGCMVCVNCGSSKCD